MMADDRLHRRGIGLRTRTSIAFAVLALLLSVSLATMTYELSRRYLLSKRESLAAQQAIVNAQAVANFLRDRTVDPATMLASLSNSDGSAVLQLDGRWFASSVDVSRESIPTELQSLKGTRIERQRISIGGNTAVVVAVPIDPNVGVYYEVVRLTELRSTLHTLALVLVIGAVITTLFGAFVGLLASRRILRPIERMALAAVSIANGHDETRLTVTDADLAPFVHSFNEMVDALQERVEREARFASDVSHELRTPLTAIRAAIDVLDRRVGDDARPALEVLQRQTQRFERLVLDLLEISRFNTGSTALALETVSPAQVVADVLRRAGQSDVPVVVESSVPELANLDRRRLERVLTNVIDNAAQYAGGATQIVISGSPDALEIAVDDAGPGVALSERDFVFERFHRGDASRATTSPGTGLGLAIAAEHCRLHRGRLSVGDSTAGGARFLIQLPLDLT